MVGFFTVVTELLDRDAVLKAVADSVPAAFRDLNLKAFETGVEQGRLRSTSAGDMDLETEVYAKETVKSLVKGFTAKASSSSSRERSA
jgi:hypothetical protein